jgi:hypothetical protein
LLVFHPSGISGGKDGGFTQPKPATLANRSPRIFIAGLRGWGWSEVRHLFTNRSPRALISKLAEFF